MYCKPQTAIKVTNRLSDLLAQAREEAQKLKGYVPESDKAAELLSSVNAANEAFELFAIQLDGLIVAAQCEALREANSIDNNLRSHIAMGLALAATTGPIL